MGHFLPFYPCNIPQNRNFEKLKQNTWRIIILHMCTKNYDQIMYGSWDIVHDGCNYFLFLIIFCSFTQKTAQKTKTLKSEKKPGDIIILHMCTKNCDQMMYGSWDMVCNRCNYFSLWPIFCPFTPVASWKIKILKNEKNTRRYYHFTYVYQKLWSLDIWVLR